MARLLPTIRLQRRTALRWLVAAGLFAMGGWCLLTRPLLSIAIVAPLGWAAWKWRGYRRRLPRPSAPPTLQAPKDRDRP